MCLLSKLRPPSYLRPRLAGRPVPRNPKPEGALSDARFNDSLNPVFTPPWNSGRVVVAAVAGVPAPTASSDDWAVSASPAAVAGAGAAAGGEVPRLQHARGPAFCDL